MKARKADNAAFRLICEPTLGSRGSKNLEGAKQPISEKQ